MIQEILHSLLIALASAFALIVLAKILLSKLIRKAPDYYEKDEAREEYEMLMKAGIIREEPAAEPETPATQEPPAEPEIVPEPAAEPETPATQEPPAEPEIAPEPAAEPETPAAQEPPAEPEIAPEPAAEPETPATQEPSAESEHVPEEPEPALPSKAAETGARKLLRPERTVYAVLLTYDTDRKCVVAADCWRADGKGDK